MCPNVRCRSSSYKPARIPPATYAEATGKLRQEFSCEVCGCRYASIGASFFCPACGHNSAESSFANTLKTIETAMSSLQAMRDSLTQASDEDFAHNAIRQVIEDQYPRLVGAFERLGEVLYDKLPNAPQFPRSRGAMQRIDEASNLWRQASGKGFEQFLTDAEIRRMKIHFQRRHVLAHRQGLVDQDYIDRSGDTCTP